MGVRVGVQGTAAGLGALGPLELPRQRLRSAVRAACRAAGVKEADISLTLLGDEEVAELNRQYLRHQGPTDVISFPLYEAPEPVVGDVYIGAGQAARAARARRISLEQELVRLAVHGALHVLGHEHPEGEARTRSAMWQLQEDIVTSVLGGAGQ